MTDGLRPGYFWLPDYWLQRPDDRGFGHVCEHGHLSRSCPTCEMRHEIALLQREVERLGGKIPRKPEEWPNEMEDEK